MAKPLNEMTNEELWLLFPIILSEHNPLWKEHYLAEKSLWWVSPTGDTLKRRGIPVVAPTMELFPVVKHFTYLSKLAY